MLPVVEEHSVASLLVEEPLGLLEEEDTAEHPVAEEDVLQEMMRARAALMALGVVPG